MIKKISNLTENKKILVESKFARLFLPGELDFADNFTSDDALFVKLTLQGLTVEDQIASAKFSLSVSSSDAYTPAMIYKCSTTDMSKTTLLSLKNNLDTEAVLIDKVNKYVPDAVYATRERLIEFDITNALVGMSNNDSVLLAIKFPIAHENDATPLKVLKPNSIEDEVCTIHLRNVKGLSKLYKYDEFSLGSTVKLFTNLFNGQYTYYLPLLSTVSELAPINFSLFHYKGENNNGSLFGLNFIPDYYYDIKKHDDEYIIEDATGFQKRYQKISEYYAKSEDLPVKHTEEEGTLYYSYYDESYFYETTVDSVTYIKLYDKADVEYKFEISNGMTKIQEITKYNNYKITFTWSGTRVVEITNTDEERVSFIYDSSNNLLRIDCPTVKQYITFEKVINGELNTLNIKVYNDLSSSTNPIINDISMIFSGSIMFKVIDNIGGEFLYISHHSGDRIYNVEHLTSDDDCIDYREYYYESNHTDVLDCLDRTTVYYFDDYGRVKAIVDQDGCVSTCSYAESSDNVSHNITMTSTINGNYKNYLNNGNFETGTISGSGNVGWVVNETYSEVGIGQSLENGKYLYMDTIAGEDVIVQQKIANVNPGTYVLSGVIKHTAGIASDQLFVKLEGTYDVVEEVIVGVDTDSTETTITNVTKTFDLPASLELSNAKWYEFKTSSITIPKDATNIKMTVKLIASNVEAFIRFDDLYVLEISNKSENLVVNSNMQYTVHNSDLLGWQTYNIAANDCVLINEPLTETSSLGVNTFKFTGVKEYDTYINDFKNKMIYQTIPLSGAAADKLSFNVVGKGYVSKNEQFKVFLMFTYDNLGDRTYALDFDKCNNHIQTISATITAEDNYSSLTVGVMYNGTNEVLVKSFQLYKESLGNLQNFYENNKLIEAVSENGTVAKMIYNKDNKPEVVYSRDGSFHRYQYNDKGLLVSATDLSGNTVEFVYDDKKRVMSQTINSSGEVITTTISYDDENNTQTFTDEFGNKTTISLDYLKRIINEITPNSLATDYIYNEKLDLEKIQTTLNNQRYSNSFTYNDKGINTEIISQGNVNYKFEYDKFNRITKIWMNNKVLEQYDYQTDVLPAVAGMSKKTTDEYGACYEFEYDSDGQVTVFRLNNVVQARYYYSKDHKLSEIHDLLNKIVYKYEYDLNGKLSKKSLSNGNVMQYSYDTLGNVQRKTYKINDRKSSIDYDYTYESNEYNKEGYIYRLCESFNDEMVVLGTVYYGNKPYESDFDIREESDLRGKVMSLYEPQHYMKFKLNQVNTLRKKYNDSSFDYEEWRKQFVYNKTFYTWVKPTFNSSSVTKIFTFNKLTGTDTEEVLSWLSIDTNGKLRYHSPTSSKVLTTSNYVSNQRWNFVGIKFSQGLLDSKTKIKIFLNSEITGEFEIDETVASINLLSVSNNTNPANTELDFALISMGAFNYSDYYISAIYKEGLKYLLHDESKSYEGVTYYDSVTYKNFDVFTLSGTLESTNGVKPLKVKVTDNSYRFDKSRIFKYDDSLHRHVFASYNDVHSLKSGSDCSLTYKLPLSSAGTILLRFKYEVLGEDKCILSFMEGTKEVLGVYITGTNKLKIVVNGVSNVTSFSPTDKIWNNLGITYTNGFTIYINGATVFSSSDFIKLYNCVLYLGKTINNIKYLNGCLEMLAYSNFVISATSLQNDLTKWAPISVRKELDSLGRICKKVITVNENNYNTTYSYDKTRLTNETLFDGTQISYTYDNMSNIKTKTIKKDNVEDIETYDYDELGRLTQVLYSNGEKYIYTYSKDGNITACDKDVDDAIVESNVYFYQGSKLQSVTETISGTVKQQMNYDVSATTTSFYPQAMLINGMNHTLTWQGNKLIGVGDDIIYSYNLQGLRIRKETANDITTFELDGTNILSMSKDTGNNIYRLDFTYDAQNQLVGLTTSEGNYFYVKDATNNILGLIDSNGNFVVKYKYDVWGKITEKEVVTSCIASEHNPFMYKGYYYDDETGLFWCNSRYYNPEWGRWISPDSIEYLDPSSINGLNLYAYCNNNPVMNYDPTGHFTILALLIGVGLSLAFEVVEDALDGNGMDHDWKDYLGAGISGLLGSMGGGLLVQAGLGVAGGMIDAWLSGDLEQNGWEQTLLSIGVSTLIGFVSSAASDFISNKIQINKLTNNAHSNKALMKSLGIKHTFNKNGRSINAFTNALKNNQWTSKTIANSLSSGISSNTTSLLFGLF